MKQEKEPLNLCIRSWGPSILYTPLSKYVFQVLKDTSCSCTMSKSSKLSNWCYGELCCRRLWHVQIDCSSQDLSMSSGSNTRNPSFQPGQSRCCCVCDCLFEHFLSKLLVFRILCFCSHPFFLLFPVLTYPTVMYSRSVHKGAFRRVQKQKTSNAMDLYR